MPSSFGPFLLALNLLGIVFSSIASAQPVTPTLSTQGLPAAATLGASQPKLDWLIDNSFAKAKVLRGASESELILDNGIVRRTFLLRPNATTIGLDHLGTGQSFLRSIRPEALLEIDGKRIPLGGLIGQKVHNFLLPEMLKNMPADPTSWKCVGYTLDKTQERFPWKPHKEWISQLVNWPPPGVRLTFDYQSEERQPGITVQVHYELYDGIPLFSKWLTIRNRSDKPIHLNRFSVEQLAVAEEESMVDSNAAQFRSALRKIQVFSDYAFGGGMAEHISNPAVQWKADPSYETQVSYDKQTPCLLECTPPYGPDIDIEAGKSFESFRVFELLHDSSERERRGLATRRAYRLLAPWVNENPILMHVRSADPKSVKLAVDQCSQVGFEMVIMTFGSGFNIESRDPKYLTNMKELADYAGQKRIALGGYSLLASRSINKENDCINPATHAPGGMRFGNSPCLCSQWGEDYFQQLRNFYEKTGCSVLEHDGSYPGDVCASTTHPGHKGLQDSQWRQWEKIRNFYQWCRSQGIYLNVPDWYYLAGSNKCGMGYRETNWSLPREWQEVIERQNIYDGTWEKTSSMGWMFVPLTEYHGGGPAATIEPLSQHLPHYESRLANLFGAGVQACYRGPRLYDTDETKAVVKRWVDFYRSHRTILDSDLIHLRRADGRDWDGWLHVNPNSEERGLAMFYNPLESEMVRNIQLPLYYTGLTGKAVIYFADGKKQEVSIASDGSATIRATIPAHGRTWVLIKGS
ncbi:hypothetical protein KIH39_17915 [Telmatocola sphagniphila]|uniref:Alpha-galactosidase n=1 Tax=Telmatocola sphagniphila TaxID=1123043 RepID=A0A8E6B3E7_9BACT|nr:hypothetical protein [Telmatocola sphagniphila]QVL30719.1 hypothetical protein KIH39_17915 [Telmatocola sphagniphila]